MVQQQLGEMEHRFRALYEKRTSPSVMAEALEVARQFPLLAAMQAAAFTYTIGYELEFDQPISAKDPTKSGLALRFSKPVHFGSGKELKAAYELTLSQTAYEKDALIVAALVFFSINFEEDLKGGLTTRREYQALSQAAVWSASQTALRLVRDVAAMRT